MTRRDSCGSFSKRGVPKDPKGYRGIIRGLYRAPLRDHIGVILRNTHVLKPPTFPLKVWGLGLGVLCLGAGCVRFSVEGLGLKVAGRGPIEALQNRSFSILSYHRRLDLAHKTRETTVFGPWGVRFCGLRLRVRV